MSTEQEAVGNRACWLVNGSYDGEDLSSRFIEGGIWENFYPGKYLEMTKSVQAGDRIALKSNGVRKQNLPFNNHSRTVTLHSIAATGTVTKNPGNGETLFVNWKPVAAPKDWYFYTHFRPIWRVLPGDWKTDALIAFTFGDTPQDINRFRNSPFWRERFGDTLAESKRFEWTTFYEAVADSLLPFMENRAELVAGIHRIASEISGLSYLQDKYEDGTSGPLQDICPFTLMGIFNRSTTDDTRKTLAKALAELLGVTEPVPDVFDGIPFLNNQNSWFFGPAYKRQSDDIDQLWEMFSKAIRFAAEDGADARAAFSRIYDRVSERWGVAWKLTMGLYWARPWSFPTLEAQSRAYINKKLGIQIGLHGPKNRCNANDYLTVLDALEARFQEDAYPVHSFPELSFAAWHFKDDSSTEPSISADGLTQESEIESVGEEEDASSSRIEPYSVNDIVAEGCFLTLIKIEAVLERLRTKKNLILQGPPGTGKTWLAKRLAFALMGERSDDKVRAVQFHPNLSYEDFVRGWRPCGDGKLTLVDGPFLEMVKAAGKNPLSKYVVVIEEINRGNPAQILGEMLTLLEADKRTPNEALELCYRRSDDERIFIPDNLYVIGTMNVADRSLALVDLALRRRFAFIDLEPAFGKPWHNWVHTKCGIDASILAEIESRMELLNVSIAADTSLGPQFRVGHSFVTPPFSIPISDAREWFRQVVLTEIGPLLDEYWFDAPDKSRKARQQLIDGF